VSRVTCRVSSPVTCHELRGSSLLLCCSHRCRNSDLLSGPAAVPARPSPLATGCPAARWQHGRLLVAHPCAVVRGADAALFAQHSTPFLLIASPLPIVLRPSAIIVGVNTVSVLHAQLPLASVHATVLITVCPLAVLFTILRSTIHHLGLTHPHARTCQSPSYCEDTR
jgi:hypothetical protein